MKIQVPFFLFTVTVSKESTEYIIVLIVKYITKMYKLGNRMLTNSINFRFGV